MISRLLKELGISLDWMDSHDSEIIKKTVAESPGLFKGETTSLAEPRRIFSN